MWPARPKIFTISPFIDKFTDLCSSGICLLTIKKNGPWVLKDSFLYYSAGIITPRMFLSVYHIFFGAHGSLKVLGLDPLPLGQKKPKTCSGRKRVEGKRRVEMKFLKRT